MNEEIYIMQNEVEDNWICRFVQGRDYIVHAVKFGDL